MTKKPRTVKKPAETTTIVPSIKYKYDEDAFMERLLSHVSKTYTTHYGGSIQPIEFIMSNAETLDYLKGNVVKYVYRFGKKGGNNIEDLYKACHFIMMMAKYAKKPNTPEVEFEFKPNDSWRP